MSEVYPRYLGHFSLISEKVGFSPPESPKWTELAEDQVGRLASLHDLLSLSRVSFRVGVDLYSGRACYGHSFRCLLLDNPGFP